MVTGIQGCYIIWILHGKWESELYIFMRFIGKFTNVPMIDE